MAWKKYTRLVMSLVELKGDPSMPRTTRWNAWFLRAFVWREVTILEVPSGTGAYHVGFIPLNGVAEYNTRILREPRFAVKHGHEDCRFFAVTLKGDELPLKIACRMKIDFLSNRVPEV